MMMDAQDPQGLAACGGLRPACPPPAGRRGLPSPAACGGWGRRGCPAGEATSPAAGIDPAMDTDPTERVPPRAPQTRAPGPWGGHALSRPRDRGHTCRHSKSVRRSRESGYIHSDFLLDVASDNDIILTCVLCLSSIQVGRRDRPLALRPGRMLRVPGGRLSRLGGALDRKCENRRCQTKPNLGRLSEFSGFTPKVVLVVTL